MLFLLGSAEEEGGRCVVVLRGALELEAGEVVCKREEGEAALGKVTRVDAGD